MKRLFVVGLMAVFSALPLAAQEAGQQTFVHPDEAARALVACLKSGDVQGLTKLVGSQAKSMLHSGDPAEDAANHEAFVKACEDRLQLVPQGDNLMMLVVGKENFPCPLPLVKKKDSWFFDGELGLLEIRARRVGRNELNAIRACEAFVQAQREFHSMDPDGKNLCEYAQKVTSSPGKHDGLYWEAGEGEAASPLGPFLAEAGNVGRGGKGKPFHGYRFRILTSQGASAPGGAYSYLINGHMVAGFALVAYPAEYGNSGIMTFLVGPSGALYQRDLKEKTAEFGSSVKSFDPTAGWKRL